MGPLDQINRRINDPMGSSDDDMNSLLRDPVSFIQRRNKRQSLNALPLAPEEESSLLADLGQGAMSGLSFVGNQLDKFTGSRALRGILGGKPQELASIIPFSDSLGLTNRDDIVSGNELLGNPKDTSLFTPEGAAGFAVEAVLDPTAPFSGFLKGGLSGAGKLAKSAGVLNDAVAATSRAARMGGKFVGPRVAKMTTTIGQHLDALDPLARQAADTALTTANKGRSITKDILDMPLGGNLEFWPTGSVIGKAGGIGEKVAGVMDKVGDVARYGNIPGTGYSPGRHFAQLFNQAGSGGLESKIMQQAQEGPNAAIPGANANNLRPVFQAAEYYAKTPHDERALMRELEGVSPAAKKLSEFTELLKTEGNLSDEEAQAIAATHKNYAEGYLGKDFNQYIDDHIAGIQKNQAVPQGALWQDGYFDEKYPTSQPYKSVESRTGLTAYDEIKGLNSGHAMWRAGKDFPGTAFEKTSSDMVDIHHGLLKEYNSGNIMDLPLHPEAESLRYGGGAINRKPWDASPKVAEMFTRVPNAPERAQEILKMLPGGSITTDEAIGALQKITGRQLHPSDWKVLEGVSAGKIPWKDAFNGMVKGNDTLWQQGGKAAVSFDQLGKATIHTFNATDVSSHLHEFSHIARRHLTPDDMKLASDAVGAGAGAWTTAHEERWATWFENYIRTGNAPTTAIGAVFAKLKQWMTTIYQSIAGTPIAQQAPKEIQDLYGRLIGSQKKNPNAPIENLAKEYSRIIEPRNAMYEANKSLGVQGERLADQFIAPDNYAARRANFPANYKSADYSAESLIGTTHGSRIGRGEYLKDMARGSDTINDFISDPDILAATTRSQIEDVLKSKFLGDLPTHVTSKVDPIAEAVAKHYDSLPPAAQALSGPRPAVGAVEDATKLKELANTIHEFKSAWKLDANTKAVPNFWVHPVVAAKDAAASQVRANSHAHAIFDGLQMAMGDTRKGMTKVPLSQVFKEGGIIEDAGLAEMAKRTGLGIDDVKNLSVPKDVADDIGRMRKMFDSPEEVSKLVGGIDSATNLFKAGVLTWPARYARDLFSGQVQNMLTGEFSLDSLKMADQFVKGKQIDALGIPLVKQLLNADKLPHTQENANRVLRAHLASIGIATPGKGAFSQVGQTAPVRKSLEGIANEIPGLSPMGIGASYRHARSGSLNPLDIKGVFGKEETRFAPARAGEALGNYTDSLNRLSPYLNMLKRGVDPKEAFEKVMGSQVEYGNRVFTPFERNIMSRVAPFYKFTRGMLPFVMERLADEPSGRLAQLVRGQARTRDENQFVPSHIAQTAAMPIPGAPEGFQRYLTSTGLMHEDPLNIVRPGQNAYKTVSGTLEELAGRLNPLAKAPLELAAGKQLYSGRDLQDLEGNVGRIAANVTGAKDAYDTPILLEQLLSNSPASRLATTVRTLTDPRKGIGAKAANLGTGFRVSDVDIEKSKNIAIRENIEDVLKGQAGVKQLRPHLYVREEDKGKLTERELKLMGLYQQLAAKQMKASRDKKKKQTLNAVP